MTYAVIYAETGDLIADFESHSEAEQALAEIIADDPHVADSVGIMAFDAAGMPVGAFEPAGERQLA